MPSPLRILFAGSGEFGLPTLRRLVASVDRYSIVHVITQPDRPAGRGRNLAPTPIAKAATAAGLPVLRTENLNREDPAALPPADVMVVIAFGQKVGEALVHRPRLGSINLHASRLPRYRGAAPINWAVINGEATTGNSVIRLAPRMDAGAVLGQSELTIGELETGGELHDRLAGDGPGLVTRVLDDLAAGRAVEVDQDESLATVAPKLSRESTALDWTRPAAAAELARRIRGLYPWPGCRVRLRDAAGGDVATLRLVRARPSARDEGPRWHPGEIMSDGCIRAGASGGVEVVEVHPDGGRPMTLADYRRGHRWLPGMRVESVVG